MNIFILLIIFFGVINLIRMTAFIVGSDIYSYKARKLSKEKKGRFYPYISIIIPAYNEEGTILRAVQSVIRNKYPRHKRDVIVVDDGSTDKTFDLVKKYKDTYQVQNLNIVRQKNKGKAHALNKAIKKFAKGEIVMCLDSDSYLAPDCIRNAVSYFKDKKVSALSANVKIIPTRSFLNTVQQFEYIVSYQMKRALTVFNIEYIIGGVGSTFRKSTLKKIGYYDSDTITEDIDVTMKILQLGNKRYRAIYGANVVAYTESVLNIQGLINQRFRWKWGRAQTFLKNSNLFFNKDERFTRGLTHFYLPYAIFGDITLLIEPVLVSVLFYIVLRFGDFITLLSTVVVISSYLALNILLESTLNTKEKIKFSLLSPFMYFFFYTLSLVEYIALVKTIVRLPRLKRSISRSVSNWKHVERAVVKQT